MITHMIISSTYSGIYNRNLKTIKYLKKTKIDIQYCLIKILIYY